MSFTDTLNIPFTESQYVATQFEHDTKSTT